MSELLSRVDDYYPLYVETFYLFLKDELGREPTEEEVDNFAEFAVGFMFEELHHTIKTFLEVR